MPLVRVDHRQALHKPGGKPDVGHADGQRHHPVVMVARGRFVRVLEHAQLQQHARAFHNQAVVLDEFLEFRHRHRLGVARGVPPRFLAHTFVSLAVRVQRALVNVDHVALTHELNDAVHVVGFRHHHGIAVVGLNRRDLLAERQQRRAAVDLNGSHGANRVNHATRVLIRRSQHWQGMAVRVAFLDLLGRAPVNRDEVAHALHRPLPLAEPRRVIMHRSRRHKHRHTTALIKFEVSAQWWRVAHLLFHPVQRLNAEPGMQTGAAQRFVQRARKLRLHVLALRGLRHSPPLLLLGTELLAQFGLNAPEILLHIGRHLAGDAHACGIGMPREEVNPALGVRLLLQDRLDDLPQFTVATAFPRRFHDADTFSRGVPCTLADFRAALPVLGIVLEFAPLRYPQQRAVTTTGVHPGVNVAVLHFRLPGGPDGKLAVLALRIAEKRLQMRRHRIEGITDDLTHLLPGVRLRHVHQHALLAHAPRRLVHRKNAQRRGKAQTARLHDESRDLRRLQQMLVDHLLLGPRPERNGQTATLGHDVVKVVQAPPRVLQPLLHLLLLAGQWLHAFLPSRIMRTISAIVSTALAMGSSLSRS